MRQGLRGLAVLAVLAVASSRVYAVDVNEVEPNDTTAQADANGAFTDSVMISGSILPSIDLDRYKLFLASDKIVRIESFGEETYTSGKECDSSVFGTIITVFDASGVDIVQKDNSFAGIGNCSALVFRLPAGTYYVEVRDKGRDNEIPTYKLQIQIQADSGTEAEPNETRATATPILGSDVFKYGTHNSAADVDYYSITVPATGGSVRADVIEGLTKSCDANAMDSVLTLENAAGTVLATDDNGGRGLCSSIDGRGAANLTGAHDLAPGTYYLKVTSSPVQGGGPAALFDYRIVVTITPKDSILKDGWESGDLSAWTAAATDGGDLRVSNLAGMTGNWGLRGDVNDTNSIYVEDQRPIQENQYRVRFRFDTNGFDPGSAQGHLRTRIFIGFQGSPQRRLFAIVLKRTAAGQYSIGARTRRDDNTQADTGFFDVAPGMHRVEILWTRASGPAAGDGLFRLWIDGHTHEAILPGLANNAGVVDFVRLGAMNVKSGANGTLYFDDFDSRRWTYVGPGE